MNRKSYVNSNKSENDKSHIILMEMVKKRDENLKRNLSKW